MLWLQASSGEEAGWVPDPMGSSTWGLATEPRGWSPRGGPTSQVWLPTPTLRGTLTFHNARTNRASSRRPPSVLPTMIQMGICQSSCLEISNVICKEGRETGLIALLSWGLGGSLGQGWSAGDSWPLVGELHPLP